MQPRFDAGSTRLRPARLARAGGALAFLLMLAGCATLDIEPQKDAVTKPLPQPAVPVDAPRVIGVESAPSSEHRRLVEMMGGEYRAAGVARYLNGVLSKLAAASDLPGEAYKVTILNTPAVNAFALPSGNLYITRGLLALANDTSEIAGVMAHEIAHVTARHASQRAEQEKRQAVIEAAAGVLQAPDRRDDLRGRSRFSLASFSRVQELEADRIGVRTIARAGFDPYGAARFLASLGRSMALRASLLGQNKSDGGDLGSTHPTTPERIEAARSAARQIGAPGIGEAGREGYLGVIEGMDFGDDPTDGAIRGRRYFHARMGLEFTAPDGFALENAAQAVLGIAAGGAEALRMDSVRVPGDTPLEAYLGSGWVDGLQKASIRPKDINSLPGAVATANAGEWSFRVAVIRMGADVHRLIYAARALTENVDKRFMESIESFRKLPPEEAGKLRLHRIALVVAGPGDSLDTFAARMAIADRPREHFLLLNGLEKSTPLKSGERYKLVVE